MRRRSVCFMLATGCLSCTASETNQAPSGPLTVFAAGSLARPMRAALDSFRVATGIDFSLDLSGSLDLARRVTELGQIPDVIALADEEVFPQLLMPKHVSWYARFARNRMVLAHGAAARPTNIAWWQRASAPGVQVGRADPDVDPAGYRTLLLFQLAERHYRVPGLAGRLLDAASPGNVRPKSAELVALLQAGELDYAYMYESSARGARIPFDSLPPEIDLGSEQNSALYSGVSVRVLAARPGDSLHVQGAPIRYGISIPRGAARRDDALAFVRYLTSPAGQRVLRAEFLDVLPSPEPVGDSVPSLGGGAGVR